MRKCIRIPANAKIDEPGEVEGNVVFTYLDAFETDAGALDALKARYRRADWETVAVKHHLIEVLERLLAPSVSAARSSRATPTS